MKVMHMTSQNTNYFLGRIFDPKTNAVTSDPLLFDPSNLTTHGVVTGMTGSGKTGLCIGLLEEAALHGTPAIIIDPKGDLTNLLLHFPALLPADFEPWIDPEVARRDGKPVSQVAQETADLWKKGWLTGDWAQPKYRNWQTPPSFKSTLRDQPPACRSILCLRLLRLKSHGRKTARCCVNASTARSPHCWDWWA